MGRDLVKVVGRLRRPVLTPPGDEKAKMASVLNTDTDTHTDTHAHAHAHTHTDTPFLFMTSHLESLGAAHNSAERCKQLSHILDTLLAFPGPALFAGDTNLREKEVSAEGR